MNRKAKVSARTLLKYAGWTGAGAFVVTCINYLPHVELPDFWIPVVGAILKTLASWIATQTEANTP